MCRCASYMATGAQVDTEPEQLNMKTDCSHFLYECEEVLW